MGVRSEIAQQPAEIVSRFGWLKRLQYQPVQYLPVPADLLMFMDVKCAGELLDISHVGHLVDAEAEQRYGVAERGADGGGRGYHLNVTLGLAVVSMRCLRWPRMTA